MVHQGVGGMRREEYASTHTLTVLFESLFGVR